ncbi:hypothetical protein EON83_11050 [bacterium]|nr:MAG: hypothetical protein EON83_11050 [bacterium]
MPEPLLVSVARVRKALAGRSMARFIEALGTSDTERDKEIALLIRAAQADFETHCGVCLFHTRIVTRPAPPDMVRRSASEVGDYDRLEDGHSYFQDDFRSGGAVSVKLTKRPVLSIESAGLHWGAWQNSNFLWKFPKGWTMPEARLGYVHIAPAWGGGAASGQGGILTIPLAYTGIGTRGQAMPILLAINYTAGFVPYEFNADTDDLHDACPDFEQIRIVAEGVRSLAALKILKQTRFAKGAGGGSIAIDGISQTHANNRFADEIKEMAADVDAAKAVLKESMSGASFMFA